MFARNILLIFTILLLTACSVSNNFIAYWNPQKSSNYNNFPEKEALYYHASDQISVKIFNNNNFADIILETNSPATLRKIYNLGLCIWLDPNGKSKNVYAINYPMPVEFPYTDKSFYTYLNAFSQTEFQEELIDRFQSYELVDTRNNESVLTNTTHKDEQVKVSLHTNNQILFSYHVRIPIHILYPLKLEQKIISIGVTSLNEANEEYYSALSSKQVIQKNLDELKAGAFQNKNELEEWWVNFKLANY
jgi:NADPH-dependent 7-cyano-7-deazaguanine reductase QueF-like protein